MFNITHIEYNIETYKNLVFKIDGKSVHENKDKIAPFFDKLEIQLKEYGCNYTNIQLILLNFWLVLLIFFFRRKPKK